MQVEQHASFYRTDFVDGADQGEARFEQAINATQVRVELRAEPAIHTHIPQKPDENAAACMV